MLKTRSKNKKKKSPSLQETKAEFKTVVQTKTFTINIAKK